MRSSCAGVGVGFGASGAACDASDVAGADLAFETPAFGELAALAVNAKSLVLDPMVASAVANEMTDANRLIGPLTLPPTNPDPLIYLARILEGRRRQVKPTDFADL